MDARHRTSPAVDHAQRGRRRSPASSAWPAASDGRAFQVRRRRTPSARRRSPFRRRRRSTAGRCRRRSTRRSIRSMDEFFDDLGQAYKKAVRGFRRRRLPLSAARRSVHRHAVRSEVPRPDGASAATIRKSSAPLYADLINAAMSDIPADMTDHHASVPRQLQIDLHGRRRLRRRGRGAVQPDQRARLFHGIRHRARRRLRAAAACCRRARPWCSASSPPRPASWNRKDDDQAPHRRGGEVRSARPARLSPQCGFASTEEGNTLTEDEQWAKLRHDRRGGRRGVGPLSRCSIRSRHRRA